MRASEDAVGVVIASPEDGAHFLSDPDAPVESNTIALRARVRGPFKGVTWHMDNEPAGSIAGDEPLHLRLRPGTHRLQARLTGRPESSPVVTIRVD